MYENIWILQSGGGYQVDLLDSYERISEYDKVFISKVFTDTPFPLDIDNLPSNVSIGGTGFYYDKAPNLPDEIEHHMPDYHLYDEWVNSKIESGINRLEFKYYLDYSIGYVTRHCFRQCEFCVNRNYKHVDIHSPIEEFYDPSRKKICLLDDNFLGCSQWKDILQQLQDLKRPFQFKQGLDERILTDEKCEMLFKSKYDGDYIFAFDNVADAELIEKKLKLIRKYTNVIPKFYCFTGFDRNDKWDKEFWIQDQIDLWKRIEILMRYKCLPYIMRFNRYEESPYRGMYIQIARWCNQPSFFKKKSLREYIFDTDKGKAAMKYLSDFESDHPEIAKRYFDMKYLDFNN